MITKEEIKKKVEKSIKTFEIARSAIGMQDAEYTLLRISDNDYPIAYVKYSISKHTIILGVREANKAFGIELKETDTDIPEIVSNIVYDLAVRYNYLDYDFTSLGD